MFVFGRHVTVLNLSNPKVIQCPAESTCMSVMMAPPQCSLGPSMRDTSQGYAWGCTVVPPTIRRLVPAIPHSRKTETLEKSTT